MLIVVQSSMNDKNPSLFLPPSFDASREKGGTADLQRIGRQRIVVCQVEGEQRIFFIESRYALTGCVPRCPKVWRYLWCSKFCTVRSSSQFLSTTFLKFFLFILMNAKTWELNPNHTHQGFIDGRLGGRPMCSYMALQREGSSNISSPSLSKADFYFEFCIFNCQQLFCVTNGKHFHVSVGMSCELEGNYSQFVNVLLLFSFTFYFRPRVPSA